MAGGNEVDTSDSHVEAIDLLANRVEAEIDVAFVAAVSALKRAQTRAADRRLAEMGSTAGANDRRDDRLAKR